MSSKTKQNLTFLGLALSCAGRDLQGAIGRLAQEIRDRHIVHIVAGLPWFITITIITITSITHCRKGRKRSHGTVQYSTLILFPPHLPDITRSQPGFSAIQRVSLSFSVSPVVLLVLFLSVLMAQSRALPHSGGLLYTEHCLYCTSGQPHAIGNEPLLRS